MNSTHTLAIFPLLFALVMGLFTANLAAAQWKTRNTPASNQDTDLSTAPIKGPVDAPVEIAVFICFQ